MKRIFTTLVALSLTTLVQAQVGIGTANPDTSAALDISSTQSGLLIPRLTTLQRDAIVQPAHSLVIYNTTDSALQYNAGDATTPNWLNVGDGGSQWTVPDTSGNVLLKSANALNSTVQAGPEGLVIEPGANKIMELGYSGVAGNDVLRASNVLDPTNAFSSFARFDVAGANNNSSFDIVFVDTTNTWRMRGRATTPKISFGNTLNEIFVVNPLDRNVGINTSTPTATLDAITSGNDATTKAFRIENSDGIELLALLNNGTLQIEDTLTLRNTIGAPLTDTLANQEGIAVIDSAGNITKRDIASIGAESQWTETNFTYTDLFGNSSVLKQLEMDLVDTFNTTTSSLNIESKVEIRSPLPITNAPGGAVNDYSSPELRIQKLTNGNVTSETTMGGFFGRANLGFVLASSEHNNGGRFVLRANTNPTPGLANSGYNWVFQSRDDAGAGLQTVLNLKRRTGNVYVPASLITGRDNTVDANDNPNAQLEVFSASDLDLPAFYVNGGGNDIGEHVAELTARSTSFKGDVLHLNINRIPIATNSHIIAATDSSTVFRVDGFGNIGVQIGSAVPQGAIEVGSTTGNAIYTNAGKVSIGDELELRGATPVATQTILSSRNSNNTADLPLTITGGNVGINTTAPASEALEVNGAIKVGDGGYTSVTDGAVSPVPAGGAGTIIFSNGHFFGWDGSAWQQLDI